MYKIITFGEIMLRLSSNGYNRVFQNNQFQATFGGAEANVAISLSNFGCDSIFVTKVPDNVIGESAINSLRCFGVDTSHIIKEGDRLGIYFVEKGAGHRNSVCIYDRKYSSIQMSSKSDFDWNIIFEGANWFHFTGITPALGDNLVDICKEACQIAKNKGIKVSCDFNYRSKLWCKEKACKVMDELFQYVDICIVNEQDSIDFYNYLVKKNHTSNLLNEYRNEKYEIISQEFLKEFGFEKIAITLRESLSASNNNWSAILYDGRNFYYSYDYNLDIVERVGGGDSFAAGLIYSLLRDDKMQYSLDFATAASALKHSIEGDFNRVTVEEVENLINRCNSNTKK